MHNTVHDLPFVQRRRRPCFWSPARTGRDVEDALLGGYYALEFLQFMALTDSACWLPSVVAAMPRRLGSVEISFLEGLAAAARAGARAMLNQEVQS